MIQAIRPLNSKYLTAVDAQKHAVLAYDVHKAPTRVVSVENTNSGTVIPVAELRRLHECESPRTVKDLSCSFSIWNDQSSCHPRHGLTVTMYMDSHVLNTGAIGAQENKVSIHMDGARLFDAAAASGTSLRDFAQCADLVTLDFSKNLGAPMGAMVLGTTNAIQRLKRTRKGIGGGMRQAGVLASAARQAVVENFGLGGVDSVGKLARSYDISKLVGQLWTERGGRLLRTVETNVVWVDLKSLGVEEKDWNAVGKRHGVRLDGKRIMVHHQICDEAVMKLQSVINEVLPNEAKSIVFHGAWIDSSTRARL